MKQFLMYEGNTITKDKDFSLVKLTRHNIFTKYHDHDYYEFFIMVDGELTESRNNENILLRKGDSLFIRPGDCHGYPNWHHENFIFYNLAFRKKMWRELVQLYPSLPWHRLIENKRPVAIFMSEEDHSHIVYSLDWIFQLENNEQFHMAGLNFLSRMALQFWFVQLDSAYQKTPTWLQQSLAKLNDKSFIQKGIPYLQEEITVSYEHFSRTFKKFRKQTLSQYLMDKRVNLAKALLESSDLTVFEIAEECGYENLSHFHHQFKSKLNKSPLKYRKQYLTKNLKL